MQIHHISDLELPALSPYRTLRRPLEHLRQGIFVAEGERVVRRLLASNLEIVSVLLTPEWFQSLKSWKHRLPDVFVAEKSLMETIVGFPLHQGMMAIAKVPAEKPLESAVSGFAPPHLFAALDGIVNAENVGVIVRNCEAFGVTGVLTGKNSSSPYLRRAVRNSMGAAFQIPIFHPPDLAEALQFLRRQHLVRIIAADPNQKTSIYHADLRGNLCFIFGNEGWGITPEILQLADCRIAIPMHAGTDSLNVGAASAVFLYEARRQAVL